MSALRKKLNCPYGYVLDLSRSKPARISIVSLIEEE
jgi:hypothetical protein